MGKPELNELSQKTSLQIAIFALDISLISIYKAACLEKSNNLRFPEVNCHSTGEPRGEISNAGPWRLCMARESRHVLGPKGQTNKLRNKLRNVWNYFFEARGRHGPASLLN